MPYFSGGQAFSDAFGIMAARFGPMFVAWLVYIVAIIALNASFLGTMMAGMAPAMDPADNPMAKVGGAIFLFYLAYLGLLFAQQVAISRTTSDRHRPAIGEALVAGLKAVPTMLGIMLLCLVGGFGGLFVLSLLSAGLSAALNSAVPGAILSLLGMLGMAFVFARLSLVLPLVAIEEQMNPISAIAGSWRLTARESFKIALIWIAVFLLYLALVFGLFAVTIGIPSAGAPMPNPGRFIGLAIGFLVIAVTMGLYVIALATAMHRQLAPPPVDHDVEAFA